MELTRNWNISPITGLGPYFLNKDQGSRDYNRMIRSFETVIAKDSDHLSRYQHILDLAFCRVNFSRFFPVPFSPCTHLGANTGKFFSKNFKLSKGYSLLIMNEPEVNPLCFNFKSQISQWCIFSFTTIGKNNKF
jgi:hypothetical protein